MSDLINRQELLDLVNYLINQVKYCKVGTLTFKDGLMDGYCEIRSIVKEFPSAQPEPFVDADKLKRCRFEYINACKIVARPTPDTSKNDIYDANAVIKALHPIFGDAEF